MKQKDIFLESEGDAWFDRNRDERSDRDLEATDLLLAAIRDLPDEDSRPGTRILEIGCAGGARLGRLKDACQFDCYGVEPSAKAAEAARRSGIEVHRGTAERLPFSDGKFGIVTFGFCLYLCDREDLFQVASEADRVLKDPGWLLILDFYSPYPVSRRYHHRKGVFSHKMDYRALFTWHPAYTTYAHRLYHHSRGTYTDDAAEWIAVSVLRKRHDRGA